MKDIITKSHVISSVFLKEKAIYFAKKRLKISSFFAIIIG